MIALRWADPLPPARAERMAEKRYLAALSTLRGDEGDVDDDEAWLSLPR